MATIRTIKAGTQSPFKGDLTKDDYIMLMHKNEDGSYSQVHITAYDWIKGVTKLSRGIKLENYTEEIDKN